MNSKKRCCRCCNDNECNKRKKLTNFEPRPHIDKENIIPQKNSCGCGCSRSKSSIELKTNLRPALGELEPNIPSGSSTTSARNCCGDVRKVSSTNTQNLNSKRNSVPLAVSTIKKNPTKSSNGVVSSKCCGGQSSSSSGQSIQKPLIYEQKPIQIYEDKPKTTQQINVSSNSYLSNKSPHESVETWLTFKTNRLDVLSLQLPHKEERNAKSADSDSSLVSNNEPNQIICDGIPSLRKKTLKRQRSVSSGYKGVVNLDPYANAVSCSISYSTYLTDIIKYITAKQNKLTIDKSLMKRSNIHPIYRTAVINWLIKLHQYLNSDASVFYICIRLFDKLLANTEIPQELLQLTGMTTYWIANKYGDCVKFLTVNDLQELSRFRYSARYIMNYERKILRLLNYDVCVEDPIIFVRYYIYLLKIEESNDMSFCANFLLDCLATSAKINTFPLSLQACAAVYLSLHFLGHSLTVWQKLETYPGYYKHEDLYIVKGIIIERMLLMHNENYEFREIFLKYACEKYNHVSVRVCNNNNRY